MADINYNEHAADNPGFPPESLGSLHLCGGTRFIASAPPHTSDPSDPTLAGASAPPRSSDPSDPTLAGASVPPRFSDPSDPTFTGAPFPPRSSVPSGSTLASAPAAPNSPEAHNSAPPRASAVPHSPDHERGQEGEKELWIAEYRREGETGGVLEPFYARDEAEARRIVSWLIRRATRPLTLIRMRRAPEGLRVRYTHLPGRLPLLEGQQPAGQDERPTITTWIEDDFIYVFMAWFRRHGCAVERLPSGHYRVTFPPGTTFEEDRTWITGELHITIRLPDGVCAEEIRLLRDDPTYHLLLIEADR